MADKNDIQIEKQDQETQLQEVIVNETMIPQKNPEVSIREEMEEDGKYILFNAENELILVINPTGKYILDSCDGERNIACIIEDIGQNFTVNRDFNLPTIVKDFVSLLVKTKLVNLV